MAHVGHDVIDRDRVQDQPKAEDDLAVVLGKPVASEGNQR